MRSLKARKSSSNGRPVQARILVVDDEPEVARVTMRVLRRERFEVRVATDGASALEVLASFKPHLVISDYCMPGMNGVELLREVRRANPRTACLMISAYANLAAEPLAGAERFRVLSKPWERRELLAAVRETILSQETGS